MSSKPLRRLQDALPEASASAGFSCRQHHLRGGVIRLSLRGELDLAHAEELHETLQDAEVSAATLVLDLDRLDFIDCSGARVLRAAAARARSDGRALIAVNAAAHVERWLRLMAVDRCLNLVCATGTLSSREPVAQPNGAGMAGVPQVA